MDQGEAPTIVLPRSAADENLRALEQELSDEFARGLRDAARWRKEEDARVLLTASERWREYEDARVLLPAPKASP